MWKAAGSYLRSVSRRAKGDFPLGQWYDGIPRLVTNFRMRFNEDPDPVDSRGWLDCLTSVVRNACHGRGPNFRNALNLQVRNLAIAVELRRYTAYRNLTSLADKLRHPGDTTIATYKTSPVVVAANGADRELGSQMASHASAVRFFEIGFYRLFSGGFLRRGYVHFHPAAFSFL
jgi:pyruvate dehydrogenase complex dehydrogenase (E1) component